MHIRIESGSPAQRRQLLHPIMLRDRTCVNASAHSTYSVMRGIVQEADQCLQHGRTSSHKHVRCQVTGNLRISIWWMSCPAVVLCGVLFE